MIAALFRRDSRFAPPPSPLQRQAIVAISVLAASLLTAVMPVVATFPLLPPLGLILLLGWRLPRAGRFPVWFPIGLGLADDLLNSGPIGTGMALWTAIFVIVEVMDHRMLWRGWRDDWMLAAALLTFALLGALVMDDLTGGETASVLILPQLALSIALYPLAARVAAKLDRWRLW